MYHGERFNSITVLIGTLVAILGAWLLITRAHATGDEWKLAASIIYSTTLIFNYAVSTFYHALKPGRGKSIFRTLDHLSIYFLIAGCYTPLCMILLREGPGAWLLPLVWGLALFGVILEFTWAKRSRTPSLVVYVGMGLLVLSMGSQLVGLLSATALTCLVSGGFFFLAGLYFYLNDRPHYHGFWHVCVFVGSACMYGCFWQII